jgi:hypothetical protein
VKQFFLRPKDMPAAIKEHYGYELTLATLNRWRRKRPLSTPARLQELCHWFERRMTEKRGPQAKTHSKAARKTKR